MDPFIKVMSYDFKTFFSVEPNLNKINNLQPYWGRLEDLRTVAERLPGPRDDSDS